MSPAKNRVTLRTQRDLRSFHGVSAVSSNLGTAANYERRVHVAVSMDKGKERRWELIGKV